MKKLVFKIFQVSMLAIAVFAMKACLNPADLTTKDAKEGGAIVTIAGTTGKVLGVPDANGVISFSANELTMVVDVKTGGSAVTKYSIVKQFNGGTEIEVESFSDHPHTLTLTTLDEFLAATGKTANELRIGDVFSFRVKMTLKDGRVVYAASGNGEYDIPVNCSSDLAGTYTVTGIYNRPASGIVGQVVGPRDEVITELSPGVYITFMTGHWSLAALGVPSCGFVFKDICGVLTIDAQNLCDAYSNQVSGTGTVDPATGNLHFVYIITGGNQRDYVFDFVKH